MKYLGIATAILLLQACTSTSTPTEDKTASTHQNVAQIEPLAIETESTEISLLITPVPADARIRVMNIRPKYKRGMTLTPGKYDIEVSKPGYETYREWIEVNTSKQIDIALIQAD